MTTIRPDWLLDSPYFEMYPEWHLKENAPKELKEKFEKYMSKTKEA